jgi:hypothetical protein
VILRERHFLQAELAMLDKMLSRTPEANVLDRMSLEDRKEEIEEALSVLIPPYYEPARARLTFRGKPVVKSDGVIAEFAGIALDKFSDMIAKVGASKETLLGASGPVPNRDRYRMMITSANPFGSFGFDLEEAPKENNMLDPQLSPVKEAIEEVRTIITRASRSSDDDLADAIADADTRAIDAIRAFLQVMTDNEATCVLESDGDPIQFADVDQIKAIEERLSEENIRESDIPAVGRFVGAMTDHRTFEFLVEDRNEIIFGKVGPGIKDVIKILHLAANEQPVKASVHTKQIGSSRPRYTLNSYEEL